jgi:hypothetical protein
MSKLFFCVAGTRARKINTAFTIFPAAFFYKKTSVKHSAYVNYSGSEQ